MGWLLSGMAAEKAGDGLLKPAPVAVKIGAMAPRWW